MPEVSSSHHALFQDPLRAVFTALKLIADHRHFGIEQRLFHLHIDHAVGFQAQGPFEVVVAGSHGFEVVGAVIRGGAVPLRAMVNNFFLDLASVGGLDKIHVLQQVGHPSLAITFVARADQIGHVDCDLGIRRVRKQQHAQSIGEGIFGDASH